MKSADAQPSDNSILTDETAEEKTIASSKVQAETEEKAELIKAAAEQWTLIVLEHLAHKRGLALTGNQSVLTKANSNSVLAKHNKKVENSNQNNI